MLIKRKDGSEVSFKTLADLLQILQPSNLIAVCCDKGVNFIFIGTVKQYMENAALIRDYVQARRSKKKDDLGPFVLREVTKVSRRKVPGELPELRIEVSGSEQGTMWLKDELPDAIYQMMVYIRRKK